MATASVLLAAATIPFRVPTPSATTHRKEKPLERQERIAEEDRTDPAGAEARAAARRNQRLEVKALGRSRKARVDVLMREFDDSEEEEGDPGASASLGAS